MKTLKALLSLMGNHRCIFLFSVAALALGVTFEAGGRLLIRDIVDNALGGAVNQGNIRLLLALFLAFALCQGLFFFLAGRWKSRTTENITQEIRKSIFNHIQRLSFHYHDRTPVGELVQRATSDVDSIHRFYGEQIPGFLHISFNFLIYFTMLIFVDFRLALVTAVIVPLIIAVSTFFFGKIFDSYERHQDIEGKVSGAVQENLNGIRVVRAFAQQKREEELFDAKNSSQREAGLSVVNWHAAYWPVANILCGTQLTCSMVYAGWLVYQGDLTIGAMVAATFLFNGLIWPLQEMGRMITEISRSFVSFDRINVILKEKPEELAKALITEGEMKGAIEFRHVCFSYVPDAPVLTDVSFACAPGDKVALLGETGSGKTSIVNLLPRFYEHESGELLIDGEPIQKYSRPLLRRNIGFVEQNPFLFTMSIRDNIAYGVERDVSDEEIVAVANAAVIHESIMSFPEQYETIVGEKGVSLSGGQKQRIAIARTLLKDPCMLILDDSTSAVDPGTELLIQKALENLLQGRTTFIIAHRIQTLKRANLILVLKEGRIVQSGTHDELIQSDGFYKKIHDIQTSIEDELVKETG